MYVLSNYFKWNLCHNSKRKTKVAHTHIYTFIPNNDNRMGLFLLNEIKVHSKRLKLKVFLSVKLKDIVDVPNLMKIMCFNTTVVDIANISRFFLGFMVKFVISCNLIVFTIRNYISWIQNTYMYGAKVSVIYFTLYSIHVVLSL